MAQMNEQDNSLIRIIAGGLFALFWVFVTAALTVFGVISMALGHVFMALAALVGTLLIWTGIPSRSSTFKATATIVFWLLMGGADYLIIRHKESEPRSAPTSQPWAPDTQKSPSIANPTDRVSPPDVAASPARSARNDSLAPILLGLSSEIIHYEEEKEEDTRKLVNPMQTYHAAGASKEQIAVDDQRYRAEYFQQLNDAQKHSDEVDTQFNVSFGSQIANALGRINAAGLDTQELWGYYQRKEHYPLGFGLENVAFNLGSNRKGRIITPSKRKFMLAQFASATHAVRDPRTPDKGPTLNVFSARCLDCMSLAKEIHDAAKLSQWAVNREVEPLPKDDKDVKGIVVDGIADCVMSWVGNGLIRQMDFHVSLRLKRVDDNCNVVNLYVGPAE